MNLDDLHIFRCVVREGGVTRAAERLRRVPSNVTTRIKQFEERLEVALFIRQGRKLVLSQAGEALLEHAERLLEMAHLAEQDVRGGILRGHLRLGALESAAGVRLPPVLSAYHANYPEISIELQTGPTDVLLKRIRRYDLQAAFVSEPFNGEGLSSVPAFEEELVLITAKGMAPIRDPKDLEGLTVVAFPNGCSYRRQLFHYMAAEAITPERVLELGSYHAIIAGVAAGAGVGIVPAEVLSQVTLGSYVMRHNLPEDIRRNRTHLVWRGRKSNPLLALIGVMKEQGCCGQELIHNHS